MIYIFIFAICLCFILVEQAKGSKQAIPFIQFGSIALLILCVGLRFKTGPDYFSYEIIFHDSELQKDMEPFFRFAFWVFNFFHSGYNVFLLFIAALSIGIKTYSIKKYSPYFFLSFLIALPNCVLGDMGQIRFSLAIATLWLSIPFCLNRNLFHFLFIIVLAASMHYSSLVFIPVYWLCTKKMNIWVILGLWGICYFLSFSNANNVFINLISDLGIHEFTAKTEIYNDESSIGGRYGISLFGLLSKILTLALILYSSIKDERLKQFYTNVYALGGCFFFLFSFSEIFGTRFSIYFFSFEALAIPLAIQSLKDIKLHYILIGVFVLKIFYQYMTLIYVSYPDMYLPYRNILQPF